MSNVHQAGFRNCDVFWPPTYLHERPCQRCCPERVVCRHSKLWGRPAVARGTQACVPLVEAQEWLAILCCMVSGARLY